MTPEALPDPVEIALEVTDLLEGLGVRYLVGGSLASSVHGEPRSTNDIDILADLREQHVSPFVEAVRPDYYDPRLTSGSRHRPRPQSSSNQGFSSGQGGAEHPPRTFNRHGGSRQDPAETVRWV